jgi:hypothetical protein
MREFIQPSTRSNHLLVEASLFFLKFSLAAFAVPV